MTETSTKNISLEKFKACIFDMDGVITQTASMHAKAWKVLFDEYLEFRLSNHQTGYLPMSIETDYPAYIDGIPRINGIEKFLKSRNIQIPVGSLEDPASFDTMHGLGIRKNEVFHDLIKQEGVKVYQDTLSLIDLLKSRSIKIAVISASKNCELILKVANIKHLFDVKVDGLDSLKLQLKGKPQPDIFIEAARQLNFPPHQCIVVEDAPMGVKAGKEGNFGLVIGIDRKNAPQLLAQNGADLVINNMEQLVLK